MDYYLPYGIYPPWATFAKTIPRPKTHKEFHFSMLQESTRKDVERAFGVLQKCFVLLHGPAEYWKPKVLWQLMTCCIILNNMIIEDEHNMGGETFRCISNGGLVEPKHDVNIYDIEIHRWASMHRGLRSPHLRARLSC
jgi:hypothetical protein